MKVCPTCNGDGREFQSGTKNFRVCTQCHGYKAIPRAFRADPRAAFPFSRELVLFLRGVRSGVRGPVGRRAGLPTLNR